MSVKISEESALEQIGILLEFYDIDPDFLPDGPAEVVKSCTRKLIRAIMKGRLEITEVDSEPVVKQFTKAGSEITYGIIEGKHREETSKVDEKNHFGKIYSLLGSMSGLGKDAISKLKGPDLTTAEAFALLFLQG